MVRGAILCFYMYVEGKIRYDKKFVCFLRMVVSQRNQVCAFLSKRDPENKTENLKIFFANVIYV